MTEWDRGSEETRKSLADGNGITFPNAKEAIKWLKSPEMAEVQVGYTSDWFDQATIKVQIIAETTDGRYVLKRGLSGLFLRPKKDVQGVHSEQIEEE